MSTRWTPYEGDRYLDFVEVEAFCRALAAEHPGWVRLEEVAETRHGRPLLLLTITRVDGADLTQRPGLWIDGGTHASEFASVMAVLRVVSAWVEGLAAGDAGLVAWFSARAAFVMPCVSPDGFQAMCDGAPYLRSSLRPLAPGTVRAGLDPCDIDGDGVVRWMRWRHPAGPLVPDEEAALLMRPRRLDDDPEEAFFTCAEGLFVQWDGVRWVKAPSAHAIDLNRNFPGRWAPMAMFGMDSGAFALSEPESRAVIDAFSARPYIGCALTNHTYTGCVLTQPYTPDSPLARPDIELLERLAQGAVEGTGYKVYRVSPDFTYDPKARIGGVWADTIVSVFGVPGYTLELWDPLAAAGIEGAHPIEVLLRPTLEQSRALFKRFGEQGAEAWRAFDHPQLGAVEIGGLDYLRTIRNPPEAALRATCDVGQTIAERLRRALPDVRAEVRVEERDATRAVALTLENLGFLPTSGTAHGAGLACTPRVSAAIELGPGLELLGGPAEVGLDHLDGWGCLQVGPARNPIAPDLSSRGHRTQARWLVAGAGTLTVRWAGGRSGAGALELRLPDDDDDRQG